MEFNATFLVALVSFIIFIIIMNWILYKPINDIVEKRKKFIDENNNEAKVNSEKSKAILQERLDKLDCAHKEVQEKYTGAINQAKVKKDNSIRQAREELTAEIEAKNKIYDEESKQAGDALKKDAVDLARLISEKFIKTSENIDIEPELIDKIMQG